MNRPLVTGLQLGSIGAICALIVSLSYRLTREPIEAQVRQHRLAALSRFVDPAEYDNDPIADALLFDRAPSLGYSRSIEIPRAFRKGELVIALVPVRAPDGYAGPIELVVAIDSTGQVRGVRVVQHTETPGFGDKIEEQKSDWIDTLVGRTLTSPPSSTWRVTTAPGEEPAAFDAISSATVTSQAVVKAVRRALIFSRQNQAAMTGLSGHE